MRVANQKSAESGGLQRQVGVLGATMMGLGSILGTGIFVSIGIAADLAGPAVLVAVAIAALVAICNGLSSAQLAANHPVSGGSYEYGYRWLNPTLGFIAGWLFLCAKSASAATAAMGAAGYALYAVGLDPARWTVPLAFGIVVLLSLIVLSGIRRSNHVNMVIVSITIVALVVFVVFSLQYAFDADSSSLAADPENVSAVTESVPPFSFVQLMEACALMFVAYTGYGRIATLGEEIHNPKRNIPIAIFVTLGVSMLLYLAVGAAIVVWMTEQPGISKVNQQSILLEIMSSQSSRPGVGMVVAIGAITAMLGVLLNLILGLSRVVLAMARRGDLPKGLSRLSAEHANPAIAVVVVGGIIAFLTLVGDVKTTWSFSAFTVLVYYSITNLAALRLSKAERLYPRFIPWCGLFSCLFLAFWVEPRIAAAGIGVIALGLVWQRLAIRFQRT